MSTSETTNKELVRGYLDAFNDRDRDAFAEYLAEDVVEHGIHRELRGIDEILEFLQQHFEIFPDYAGTTEAMIAEGDTVAVRYTVSGTHTGEYRDIKPTGHTVEWSGLAVYRIEDDEIAEIWIEEDRIGLLEQLEIVDPPAHLRI
ncbi:MAG: ester cyclase [Salinirussus sp.]